MDEITLDVAVLDTLLYRVYSGRRMQICEKTFLHTNRVLKGSLDGILAFQRVPEGSKRGIQGGIINDVILKDLSLNFTSNITNEVHIEQLNYSGRPSALSNT